MMKRTFIFVSALFCIFLALTEHSVGQGRRPGRFPIPQEIQPFWPHEHHEHAGGGRIIVDVMVGNEVITIETTNPHGISVVPKPEGGYKLRIGPNDRIVDAVEAEQAPFLKDLRPCRRKKTLKGQ